MTTLETFVICGAQLSMKCQYSSQAIPRIEREGSKRNAFITPIQIPSRGHIARRIAERIITVLLERGGLSVN